jgi:hypothetical protein
MSEIKIVQLQSYTAPEIKVSKRDNYVTYGSKNSYFQYLIDRYTGSPTNNAVINGVSQMVFGKGLDATDSNKKPDEYAQAVTLFHKDCIRKLVYDLKLMGQCAIQVIYSKDRTKVAQIEHMPVETLAMEKCNDKGEVEGFYYCSDWTKIKPNQQLKRIPAFGTSQENIEILYVRPYVAGHYYYSPVDYQGGLQYAELEEEISNYHLNNIMQGLAPSMLVNFNNGVPNEEERANIEQRIIQKFSGSSNAGKFILSFNENQESAAEIVPVQLSDAHNQYQFLSDESMRKIMVAHRVVSPMLLGIKDQTGLGNNAEELKTASTLMDNVVIQPLQHLMIDALNKILAFNNISLNLYFKTLQPLEFIDLENVVTDEQREEETGEKVEEEVEVRVQAKLEQLSKEDKGDVDLSDDEYLGILTELTPDIVTDEWEEVTAREYSEGNTSDEEWATENIELKTSLLQKFADVISAKSSGFSYLDKSYYKIRYRYAEKYRSSNTRKFCKAMMARNQVYRIEDIDQASAKGVNRKFGHKQKPYDLFKFKGGVNCGHYWEQVLYRLKKDTNGKFKEKSEDIKDYVETNNIPRSYVAKPRGSQRAGSVERDRADRGAYPS